MQKFITDLSSIYWWIGVVLVGIVINIFSSYLKTKIDSYMGSISKSWKEYDKEEKARFDCEVNKIKQSPQMLNLALFSEIRARMNAIIFVTTAIFMFVLAIFFAFHITSFPLINEFAYYFKLICLLIAAILFGLAMNFFNRANEIHQQIKIASKRCAPSKLTKNE